VGGRTGEGGGVSGFVFRRLEKPEEFRAAEELQRSGPTGADEPVVPVSILRAVQDHGGLVLGAFADIYLAGVSLGFLGWDGSALYHYVHRFAVRPEYRHHGLGFRLAGVLRDEVRRQGIDSVRGSFDPLSREGATLAVHRLGALPDRYLVHYYGQQGGSDAVDRESDRLRFGWMLSSPLVEERIAAPRANREAAGATSSGIPEVVETQVGESGLRIPIAVVEPTAPRVRLEIPFDLDLVRQHEPRSSSVWRHAVRDAFRASFDLGYTVDDFVTFREGHERRGAYVLAKSTPPPS